MENNELYKIYSFNGGCYDHLVEPGDFVNKLVEPIREIATVDHKDICFIWYGEKSSGKSTLCGTLPTFSDNEDNICFYTLVTLFSQIETDRAEEKESALQIDAFEIFADAIVDLVNYTTVDSKYDCSTIVVYTIGEAVNVLREIYMKRKQLVQQFDDSDMEISSSQSHLVIEMSIQSEVGSGTVTIMDLVGFDSNFTSKIMQGNTDFIPYGECTEEEFILHYNDYSLFSLRNMLLEMVNESYIAFETHLAQFVYEIITDKDMSIVMVGKINNVRSSFHESLNTLEFCSKFMHSRCLHQEKDSILIANNFTRLENFLDPKCNSMPIHNELEFSIHSQSDTEQSEFNQESEEAKLQNLEICREVQISYLDNNCSFVMGPNNLTHFYEQKVVNIESPYDRNIYGANGKIDIPQLNLGHKKHISVDSEIIEGSDDSSQLESSAQFSLISGQSKESLKGSIQWEVEKLMTKFCSKQELEDIMQENTHPNIQKQEISNFAENLIENINQKLSQREIRKSSARRSNIVPNMFEHRAFHRNKKETFNQTNVIKNCHTFDTKRMNKYVFKSKVKNLSPISKQDDSWDLNNEASKWNEISLAKEVEFWISGQLEKNKKHQSLSKKAKIPSSNLQIERVNGEESEISHVVPSCASPEEEKLDPRFSVYEVDRSHVDRKTKETMNNTDDILEIEMIQLKQKSNKKQKNSRKEVEKGIKMIFRTLRKTERTMGTLLDIMFGAEISKDKRMDREGRKENTDDKKSKPKRSSSSVFSWFGGVWTSNRAIVKKRSSDLNLRKQSSMEVTAKKLSFKSEKNKEVKKSRDKRKEDKEASKTFDRVPVVKQRSKHKTSKIWEKDDASPSHIKKEIDLTNANEEVKKNYEIIDKSKNRSKKRPNTLQNITQDPKKLKILEKLNSLNMSKDEVLPKGATKWRPKLSPKGSMNSETRLETMKSIKNTTGYVSNQLNKLESAFEYKLNIDEYLKNKVEKHHSSKEKRPHSSRNGRLSAFCSSKK
jgi:hypothetical protein